MKKGDKVKVISKQIIYHTFPINSEVEILSIDKDGDLFCEGKDIHGVLVTQYVGYNDIMKEPLTVATVLKYHKLYQSYLLDQDLVETDNSLTVDKLIEFVEQHLLNG